MKVELNEQQKELRKVMEENLSIAKNDDEDYEVVKEAFKKMKDSAHTLHMQLTPSPKHHEYMIKNRGVQPEDPEFYNHIHPVEDLLDYLDDTSANDDPIDVTMGDTFDFRIHSERWGHEDNYGLTRTDKGWKIKHISYQGEDDLESDMPTLRKALMHESISFPRDIDSYFYSIWKQAKDKGLNHGEVQDMLNQVANWISEMEKKAPRDFLL